MIEIVYGNNPNASPINIKIERRDFKSEKVFFLWKFLFFYFILNRSSINTTSISLDTDDKIMGAGIPW